MQALRSPTSASLRQFARRYESTQDRPLVRPMQQATRPWPAGFSSGDIPQHEKPAVWQRFAQVVGFVAASGTAVYMVLFQDFEQERHCFTGIREQYATLRDQFMTLPDEVEKPGTNDQSAASKVDPRYKPRPAGPQDRLV